MRKVKFEYVIDGKKFYYEDKIFIKGSRPSGPTFSITDNRLYKIYNEEVDLHWWEHIDIPSKIQIMEAYQSGADIEYIIKGYSNEWTSPTHSFIWNFEKYKYRIKPQLQTHKIIIDDKEIEISHESYTNLKNSLT